MKVTVVGLWHLGTVTAACLASAGHDVTGLDSDAATIANLSEGRPPVLEPGLEALVAQGLSSGRLRFTTSPEAALEKADVAWIAFDTPVDEDDHADVDAVVGSTAALFPFLPDHSLVLISSQIPVGTTARLESAFAQIAAGRRVDFAYAPENLRLGNAIQVFTYPDRVVVGVRTAAARARIAELLHPFTGRIESMTIESAEMTKHAINAFLAASVSFINEVAAICEKVGADAAEVERGLKSEARIGPKAYVSPGAAFAGGTLARDVTYLSHLGKERGLPTHLLNAIKASNDAHRQWADRRLTDMLRVMAGETVAIWGLTYKPGTDTLRRSSAIELARSLHRRGVRVQAYDPAIATLSPELGDVIQLSTSPLAAASNAIALVVATPWPEFRDVSSDEVASRMSGDLVIDANRFLAATLGQQPRLRYVSVGRAA